MKKTLFITVLFSVIVLSGCSKDEPVNSSIPFISKIIMDSKNTDPVVVTFNYDTKNRLTDYTYDSDKIHYKSAETHSNGTPKYEKILYLDDSGKVSQFYDVDNKINCFSTYTYDSQNRISNIVTNFRDLDENGEVINTYKHYYNAQFEWDSNNNVQKITYTMPEGLFVVEEFLEYTSIKNTISLKNIGLDFFGEYPERGHYFSNSVIKDNSLFFGSAFLPGKVNIKTTINGIHTGDYLSKYSYKVDEKDRVVEVEADMIVIEPDEKAFIYPTVRFKYGYID